ncbi:MAG: DnaJ domain-containing protein [Dehalococcoidia bacterium]|nr:DnaJ domain-containing protein [Dehalococcoidia bacterium]
MADYYSVLGVDRGVEQNDIRRAFRRLARKYHPDLNKDDSDAEAKFKEVNEAYEVLSDPDSRRKYDVHGDQWKHADEIEAQRRAASSAYGFRGGAYRGRPSSESDLFTGLEDILGDVGRFRGSRHGAGTIRSETSVTVSLEEAYAGTTINANYTVRGRNRRFEVSIPPGVDNGSTVRVTPEQGTEMLFRVSVSPNGQFRREGTSLYTDVDVPFEQCILGGEAQIQTLNGRTIWVRIPANSQNGQNIRLRGQGMPRLGSPDTRGDLYVTVRPQMPRSLTDEQRELIVKLQELRSGAE